jgi:hypothetical protein
VAHCRGGTTPAFTAGSSTCAGRAGRKAVSQTARHDVSDAPLGDMPFFFVATLTELPTPEHAVTTTGWGSNRLQQFGRTRSCA